MVNILENSIFVPRLSEFVEVERFLNRVQGPIPPCLRSLYAPQPISDRLVGLGFPRYTGRCRSEVPQVSFPGCWSCKFTERRLNRGWYPILPRCDGTGGGQTWAGPYSLGVVIALRAPAHQRSARGNGVSTPCWVVLTRRNQISSPVYRGFSDMEAFPNRRSGPIFSGPGGIREGVTSANQPLLGGIGVSTPSRAVSTWDNSAFVPGLRSRRDT